MKPSVSSAVGSTVDAGAGDDWRSRLLLTERDVTMRLEPFPYFFIDDYLPADLYARARSAFPVHKETDRYSNKKQVFSAHRHPDAVRKFVDETPVWNELVSFFDSSRFVSDLNQFLRPALVKARGVDGRRVWRRRDREPVRPIVDVPVVFGYEFSILEDGAHLKPHTDSPAKLVSLLLYFPEDGWKPEFGGTTDMYRAKDSRQDRNWMNRNLEFDAVETVFSSAFLPNRLFGFVKSANSLHGVSPVTCGPDHLRLTFNFNVLVDPVEADSRIVRLRNEWIRRQEAPAFAPKARS